MNRRQFLEYGVGAVFAAGHLTSQVTIEPRARKGAPEPDPTSDGPLPRPTLRVDTNIVLVPAEVSDEQNRPVSGLEKENFQVYDDKVLQTIASFAMEDEAIGLGMIFDTSSSMDRVLRQARSTASVFFRNAEPEDEFFLVEFDNAARVSVPLTKDPREIDYELISARSKGSTALIDGVYLALNEIRKSKMPRKALILISDGGENNSRYSVSELERAMLETDVILYCIELGHDYYGPSLLKRISEQTGGRSFPANVMNISDVAEKIVIDLRNRYIIGFSPTDKTRDGRFHQITVRLNPPRGLGKLRTRWRQGYYAPAS